MKTKGKSYILLGGKVQTMHKCWQKTLHACSQEVNPLILICGFPAEVAYYLDRIDRSDIEATVYASDMSWDTFTNFSKDIAYLLRVHHLSDTHFVLFAGTSHACRIKRIVKYMQRWNPVFRSCNIEVFSDSDIPAYRRESIAYLFYHLGCMGMYLLTALSYYRKWKKSSR